MASLARLLWDLDAVPAQGAWAAEAGRTQSDAPRNKGYLKNAHVLTSWAQQIYKSIWRRLQSVGLASRSTEKISMFLVALPPCDSGTDKVTGPGDSG